jgi:hypothetical protein
MCIVIGVIVQVLNVGLQQQNVMMNCNHINEHRVGVSVLAATFRSLNGARLRQPRQQEPTTTKMSEAVFTVILFGMLRHVSRYTAFLPKG